jgi:hypothetical protein
MLGSRQDVAMQVLNAALFAGVFIFAAQPAAAESLRCQGGIVAEGDSRLSVVYKCGQPTLKDQFCAPVFYKDRGTWRKVPHAVADATVPCQQVEHWLYERGQGELMATVRLRGGVVQAIIYGHVPE